jgi:hypothetical protein
MADMICHKVYELLMSILSTFRAYIVSAFFCIVIALIPHSLELHTTLLLLLDVITNRYELITPISCWNSGIIFKITVDYDGAH